MSFAAHINLSLRKNSNTLGDSFTFLLALSETAVAQSVLDLAWELVGRFMEGGLVARGASKRDLTGCALSSESLH